ncbi:MAG: hypothetical protein HC806_04190 [Anaerolineae bacterium]|nr:hypothetical protein [Anaerolineae bacterium]
MSTCLHLLPCDILLTAANFFFWLITTLQGLLYHTYTWQLKEYRVDRILDFVRSNRRMVVQNTLAWLFWEWIDIVYSFIWG